jgi:uncharacterized RDD family membrane protein YckC
VSSASVPPPGWVRPRASIPVTTPLDAPERVSGGDFAATIAAEDRRGLDTRRVGARIIDAILCAPAYFLALHQWGDALGSWAVYQLAQLILAHLCEVTVGQTPGKHLMKLRVARKADGGLPTPRQAAVRGVLGIVEWGLIGLIALHVSKGRTRLGDRAAATVVVDVQRHPIPSRGLTTGTFTYPVLWAIPVVLLWVGSASGSMPGSYRHQADAICRRTDATIRATVRSDGPYALHDAWMREYDALSRLHAPVSWRARQEALLARTDAMLAFDSQVIQDVEMSRNPQATWLSYDGELGARLDGAAAAAKAAGYHDCAR